MASVRDWDEQSHRSDRGARPVTVRRYKISDVDEQDERWETTSRVSRRETEPRARSRSRATTREFRFEREVSRSPSPEVRQIRIERDVSRDPPRHHDHDDYELDHYTRSTEYYERERPERERRREGQTIIIKNEAPSPVIIRERENVEGRELTRRESSHEEEEKKQETLEVQSTRSQRSVSVDNRQVARRDASPEEDYYYQRTRRELVRRPQRDEYDDYRQARQRPREDNYSDDEVYYRRTEYTDPDEHTIRDPNHRRHLAEGAIVGLGAAALANHNKKKKGEKSGGAGNLIGGAVVGAAGTELYSRANRYWKERESSRDREYSGRGRRYDSPGRSRERSHSRGHDLAKYGAMAAIGALAGYAASRAGKDKKDDRRSRSRRRRQSRGRHSRSRSSSNEKAPSASKRNSTIAGAGLASAAVAGLVERHRSKSRGGRSKSRIRTGLPIAAAGLGGAALAGLYEKNKAKKAKEHARTASGSRSPSRSRSRSVAPDERSRDALASDDHLIEYGEGTIPPEYGRPRSRADSEFSGYGRHRGSPSSAESSPRRHRHGGSGDHHHAAEAAAVGAAGAGIAGVAAHEASQRRERKRAERERRRQEEDRNGTPLQQQDHQGSGFGPYAQEPPAPMQQPQQAQNFYPPPNNFGAAPNAYTPVPNFTGQAAYAPQEYAQPQPQYAQQQQQQMPPAGNFDPSNAHYPPPGQHVSSEFPESKSASRPTPPAVDAAAEKVGSTGRPRMTRSLSSGDISPLDTTRIEPGAASTDRRASRVHFDLEPQTRSVPDTPRVHSTLFDDDRDDVGPPGTEDTQSDGPGRRRAHGKDPAPSPRQQHRREQAQRRSSSPASDDSSDTIILPDRFDGQGRRKPERGDDPLADAVQDMFEGKNGAGRMLRRFLGARGSASAASSRGTPMRRSRSE